jgi:hypothetical protein
MFDPARYRRRCIMATLQRRLAPLERILNSHNVTLNPPPILSRRVAMRLPACPARRGRCRRRNTMRPRRTVAKRRLAAHPTDNSLSSRATRTDGCRSQPHRRRRCSMPSGCTVAQRHQHQRLQNNASCAAPTPGARGPSSCDRISSDICAQHTTLRCLALSRARRQVGEITSLISATVGHTSQRHMPRLRWPLRCSERLEQRSWADEPSSKGLIPKSISFRLG